MGIRWKLSLCYALVLRLQLQHNLFTSNPLDRGIPCMRGTRANFTGRRRDSGRPRGRLGGRAGDILLAWLCCRNNELTYPRGSTLLQWTPACALTWLLHSKEVRLECREAQECGRRMQSRELANLCGGAWLLFPSLQVEFCCLLHANALKSCAEAILHGKSVIGQTMACCLNALLP